MKLYLLPFLVLLVPSFVFANDLTGVVKSEDGTRLAGAIVKIYTARPRTGRGVF